MTAQSMLTSATSLYLIIKDLSFQPFGAAVGFAIMGFWFTNRMIPRAKSAFVKRGLFGKDMSKPNHPVIPETIGLIPAVIYLFLMILFIPFMYIRYYYNQDESDRMVLEAASMFPNGKLSSFLSGMLCLESMILLGLLDDLFDIRWRHKFFLPAIAAIPLLVIYYVDFGVTSVLIPKFLRRFLNVGTPSIDLGFTSVPVPQFLRRFTDLGTTSIDLGGFYYFYMAAVAIFCPNSINIMAGVNGLEVGQTVVLAVLLLLNDSFYLVVGDLTSPAYSVHLYSTCALIPFLGVSLALLKYNWYPSSVFVGDTWCYFSGMVFAVVGISGHFAKTLMLFFVPQIFNFIYSLPQLFGLVPCPRHRLPHYDPKDNLLHNSWTVYDEKNKLKPVMKPIMNILEKLHLIKLERNKDGSIARSTNMTIINLVLIWFGPKREDKLCALIMLLQFLTGLVMLVLRHTIAPMMYGFDNSWNMLARFDK